MRDCITESTEQATRDSARPDADGDAQVRQHWVIRVGNLNASPNSSGNSARNNAHSGPRPKSSLLPSIIPNEGRVGLPGGCGGVSAHRYPNGR